MIAYTIFFFLLIVALLRYTPSLRLLNSTPWVLPIGFSIKLLVGFIFLYVYSYHYGVGELTADASAFMHDSKVLNNVFYHSPSSYFRFMFGLDNQDLVCKYLVNTEQWDANGSKWFNDSRNILRLHSLIHFISFGQQAIHLMVLSLISLLGTRLMTLAVKPFVKLSSTTIFFALLLIPNVLFWSSGILKEPLIIFSMGLFLYVLLGNFGILKKSILLMLSLFCLIGIKPYILFCALPAILVYFLFHWVKKIKLAFSILIIAIIGGLLSLATPVMKSLVNKLSFQQFDFINIGKGGVYARADTCIYIIYGENMPYVILDEIDSTVILTKAVEGEYILPDNKKDKKRCLVPSNINEEPWKMYYDGEFSGSYIEVTPIKNSGLQLIKNIPEAIQNVLLRPYPNDPPHSKFKYLTLLDTWGLLILFFVVVFFFRRKINREELNIIIALSVFSFVLTLLIGWTTPVLGAIIRYKIPIQLALMIITLIVFKPQKIKNE